MAIIYPENRTEVSNRISTDVQNELPEIVPSLRNALFRAYIIAFAGRFFDIYTQQQLAQLELFPDTASTLEFIRRWGLFKGIDINAASPALGLITASGTATTVIPEGTIFQTSNQIEYEVINQNFTIQIVTLGVATITRAGSLATAIFNVDHNFATGTSVTFSGADQAEYNITATVTAISELSVTYTVSGSPATPATGTPILASSTIASVSVQSVDTGNDQNLDSGAVITLKTPIAGVDDDSFVQFTTVNGGQDEDTNIEYRTRVLDGYANPISNSNDSDIERLLKQINGITKVWTFDAIPQPGQFTTYFIRGNDTSIFPDANEVNQAKDLILTIKPAPMLDADVIVSSPTPVDVPFTFISLVPNSQSMQSAIETSLKQFFLDETEVRENVTQDSYRCAIKDSINPETGEFVKSFGLSTPIGDIAISDGELASRGSITWNI